MCTSTYNPPRLQHASIFFRSSSGSLHQTIIYKTHELSNRLKFSPLKMVDIINFVDVCAELAHIMPIAQHYRIVRRMVARLLPKHAPYCTCTVLHLHCIALALYCTCTVLHLHCIARVLYCTCTILHLHCIAHVLYCTCTVLQCTVLHLHCIAHVLY